MNNKGLNTKLIDTLFAHVNDVFYIRDASTEGYPLLYVNDAYHTIWGKTTKSLFKNPDSFMDSVHPDDKLRVIEGAKDFLIDDHEIVGNYRIIDFKGKVVFIQSKTFLVKDPNGTPLYIVGYAKDHSDVVNYHSILKRLNVTQDLIIQLLMQDLTIPISGIKYLAKAANHQIKNAGTLVNASYVKEIISQSNDVLKMLEDLLIYLEIQGNRVRITLSSVFVEYEIRSVINSYKVQAEKKNISISLSDSSTNITIDIVHFHQIIGNILSNAIKFTPSNGSIHISINEEDTYVLVRLTDSGVGIPKDLLPLVALPFKGGRAGLEGERSFAVGLYISKMLMKIMKGSLDIESQVSKGTTIELKLAK